jgi:hypothetical protein
VKKKYLLLLSLFIISCYEKIEVKEIKVYDNIIKINANEKTRNVDFDDYFSSWKIIPLETSERSIIGNIDRLSVAFNKFFILDRGTNSIVVFSDIGNFLFRIKNIGRGVGEYNDIMDFAVDEKNERLIIYSHRPYKVIMFDLNGNFLEEEPLSYFYNNISSINGEILFLNASDQLNHRLFFADSTADIKSSALFNYDFSKYFSSFSLTTPSMLKDNSIHITFPYSDTVFQYSNAELRAKYIVDFSEKRLPKDFVSRKLLTPIEIFKSSVQNEYGFGISNFKEVNDFVFFSYGPNTFQFIKNKNFSYSFGNIFGHDGTDNNMVSIISAGRFKNNFVPSLNKEILDSKVFDDIMSMAPLINDDSNPLLLIYTFK